MTLTEFLLARIAEEEADVAHIDGVNWTGDRVLAECAAKRRVIARAQRVFDGLYPYHADEAYESRADHARDDLRDLAAIYADHPDYREEWKL
jgi:hypothetical protein